MKKLTKAMVVLMVMAMLLSITAFAQETASKPFHLPEVKVREVEEEQTEVENVEPETEPVEQEPAEEEEQLPEEETEPEANEHRVEITVDIPGDAVLESGTVVTFHAKLFGYEDEEFSVQWQVSTDGVNYTDIPGANGLDYSVAITEANANSCWRVEVNN